MQETASQHYPPPVAVHPPRAERVLTPLLTLIGVAALWLGSGVLVPPALAAVTNQVRDMLTIFFGIVVEALPFLVAGVLLSAVVQQWLSPTRMQRLLPDNRFGAALIGGLIGLCFPACECGAIPAARSLMRKGAPLPLGISFVLAAPVVNPVVIISTAAAFVPIFGWGFVAARVGLTLAVALVVAMVASFRQTTATVLANQAPTAVEEHVHHRLGVQPMLLHAADELFEMSRYLLLGALIAALLQTVVPRGALVALGTGPVVSVLVVMALALLLSVCSTVDAFVALSLVNVFGPGTLLAFLVFGPMIDLKSLLMLGSTFRRRTVVQIALLAGALVLVSSVAINLVLQ